MDAGVKSIPAEARLILTRALEPVSRRINAESRRAGIPTRERGNEGIPREKTLNGVA
jgi:hypothetical protein